jgi:tetratricopeptide (TPR) repeat protein
LDAIVAMMEGYGAGKSNAQVFSEVLGQTLEAFDEAFDEYVNERWGPRLTAVAVPDFDGNRPMDHASPGTLDGLRLVALANPGNFQARLAYGQALFLEDDFQEAEEELRAAYRLYPEFGGLEGPLFYLAEIHKERGELERAGRALQQLGLLNETLYPVHMQEAAVWLEVGDQAAAAQALEKALEVHPFDLSGHGELAGIYEALGEHQGAVRERRAVLALEPTDKAEAHYRLAAALARSGERTEARTLVLRALEIAPTYEAALDLLLALRGGGGVDDRIEEMDAGKACLR